LGLTLVRSGAYGDAVAPLRRSLEIEPENDGARRSLALALIGTEQFPEASRQIALLLAKSERDPALLEMAAQSFMHQRRYAEAARVLKRRIDLGNAPSQLWAEYGDALDGAKRTPEAVDAYREAVRLAPDSTASRYGLGYLFWKLYRYKEAEREL